MNQCNFIGRFTRDPELRHTQTNTSVVNFSLAVERERKDKNNNFPVDYIDFVAWGPTAEFIERNCKKGTLVRVTGALEINSFVKDGETRNRAEVNVKEFKILVFPKKKNSDVTDDFKPVSSDEGTLPFDQEN